MIKYHEGVNLFSKIEAMNNNDYIVHSCNNQRVWGAGFAKQLKIVAPNSYLGYLLKCKWNHPFGPLLCLDQEKEGGPMIMSLIVSNGYGSHKDPPTEILKNTKQLLESLYLTKGLRLHSPKINSGLFGVPWENTEKIIQEFVNKTGCEWNVYSL